MTCGIDAMIRFPFIVLGFTHSRLGRTAGIDAIAADLLTEVLTM